MLSLFRTNQLILGIFLIAYVFLLRFWLPLSLGTATAPTDLHLLSDWVYGLFNGSQQLAAIFTLMLVWIQALLINQMVAHNRLVHEVNLFPGLFYIIICSSLPAFQAFSPLHLANTFLILAVSQLFRIYKQNHCMDYLFNAGFFIGLASMCYGPYILFLIPVLIGLSILRAYKGREWLSTIIGGLVPIIWLTVYGFLNDKTAEYWSEWSEDFGFIQIDFQLGLGNVIGLVFFALVLLLLISNYSANLQRAIIEVRKKIDILYWILIFGGVLAIFTTYEDLSQLLLIAVPIGILLSFMFIRMKRATAEIFHLLLLVSILLLHYVTYAGLI